ncbi:MAG: hypothetical protein DKINENOH_00994 [bacterium]|nr:hypothetical protein [bacterium]
MYSVRGWAEFITKHIEACTEGCLKTPFPNEFNNRIDLELHRVEDFFRAYEISPLLWSKLVNLLPPCKRCGTKLSLTSSVVVGLMGALTPLNVQKISSSITKYRPKFDDFLKLLENENIGVGIDHPLAKELLVSLKKAYNIEADGIQWFRARHIDNVDQPNSTDLLAPPSHLRNLIPEGRYNDPREIHFYVSNTFKGAAREIYKRNGNKTIWVQQFDLASVSNILKLTIFDSVVANDELLLYLILSGILDRVVVKEYRFTRLLKELAKELKINGILYSQDEFRYINLVLFDPEVESKFVGIPVKYIA